MEPIITKNLLIREIIPSDINVLLSVYSKEENMKYISNGKYDWTIEELKGKYEKVNTDGYPQGYGIFAVVADRKIIGESGLFNSFGNKKSLELGYILDNKYWNRGYGTEICSGLLDYGFNALGVDKIIARMYPENIGSISICEKLKFRKVDVVGAVYCQYERTGL
ncbi:GNAT family N-acetyltransferase [uncultured Bacteroides sp.]|uniref:GNAT family N-acetyltransferase n=1 Tax=uncultured Bacteroides sp. TaxID=162156 RepID=UPI002AAA76F1|nr:GNAT family N-acetyltransferase [uncultured Bacteroides sp.]